MTKKQKKALSILAIFLFILGIWSFQLLFPKGASSPQSEVWRNLRVKLKAYPFTLLNQEGEKISLEDFRGKVVLLSGVYATCGYT